MEPVLAWNRRGAPTHRAELDPIEAARVVVSDEVALLWSCVKDRLGFAEARPLGRAQLVRWESETDGPARVFAAFGRRKPRSPRSSGAC